MKSAIAYIRVSTARQGKSGLGLEAQQALIQRFADQEGFQIGQTFTEVQSEKDDDEKRPQLAAALEAARKAKGAGYRRQARSAQPRRALHFRPHEAQG